MRELCSKTGARASRTVDEETDLSKFAKTCRRLEENKHRLGYDRGEAEVSHFRLIMDTVSQSAPSRIAEAVTGEGRLSREDARQLLLTGNEDLPTLLASAQRLRRRFKPGVVTYSRKVFIPLTNLCRDYCGYCTFRRDPGQPGAHTMTPDEVMEVVHAGERLGCTEALFSLIPA